MLNLPNCSRLVRPVALAIALAAPLLIAGHGSADIIKKEDMLRGVSITREQCDAILQAVWVNAHGRDFCVRYYISTVGGEGRRPVVFLEGDKLGVFNGKTRTWNDPSRARDVDTAELVGIADGFSRMVKTTAIYLARVGIDGTSGDHMARKTVLERDVMNAALDAIKQRYRFEGFHLAGQSGGSTVILGLLPIRTDIDCAVPGSAGSLTGQDAALLTAEDPGRRYFDALHGIPAILQKRQAARFIMVTEPQDRRAGVQNKFFQELRKAGGQAEQFNVLATDDDHHGVLEYTRLVVAGCVLGKSNVDIARAVSTIVKRNTAFRERKEQEAAAKTATRTGSTQPAPVPVTRGVAPERPATGTAS